MLRFWIIASVLSFAAIANPAFIVPPLQEQAFNLGPVSVIVTLRRPDFGVAVSAEQRAQVSQLVQQVLAELNSKDFQLSYQYQTIPCFSGMITRSGLAKLAENPGVEYVELDQQVQVFMTESVPSIRADSMHSLGYTGKGCVVGVLDTGVDSLHVDLMDDIIAQHHFLYNGQDTGYGAFDDNGHGTFVSGVITSKGVIASVGVAPDAKIVAVKVLNFDGFGWMSDVISGLDWMVANNDYLSADVINMSLGGVAFSSPCDSIFPGLKSAIDACRAAGISVFVASGNAGYTSKISFPACITGSFSVGATYDADLGREPDTGDYGIAACFDSTTSPYTVACFSNRRADLSLLGPGSWIIGPWPGNTTMAGAGTSLSTPHCAGVAALICEMDSTLEPDSVLNIMQNTGVTVYDAAAGLYLKRVDALGAQLGCTAIAGDANASGTYTLADVIALVNYVFNRPGCIPLPICWLSSLLCRGDWNGSGSLTLSDVIQGANFIFNKSGGPWSPLPLSPCCQPAP